MGAVIHAGHALDVLRTLAAESVQTCVTSPPYYGLRRYGLPDAAWGDGWVGELGHEPGVDGYIGHLVEVFREVRRILRRDGTLWLNLGDSYSSGGRKTQTRPGANVGQGGMKDGAPTRAPVDPRFGPKQLLMVPHRTAMALQEDGWIVRLDVVWSKPSSMPERVEDRPSRSHEYLFLLAKSPRYYYDHHAILEPTVSLDRNHVNFRPNHARIAAAGGRSEYHAKNARSPKSYHPGGRNRRSVWTVPAKPTKIPHYAAYPPKLIEPCILASTSERGHCPECGMPWKRLVEKGAPPPESATRNPGKRLAPGQAGNAGAGNMGFRASTRSGQEWNAWREQNPDVTIGWAPACACAGARTPEPDVVLDPFSGIGTTGMVAVEHCRSYVGIELNERYAGIARRRLASVTPRGLLF